MRPSIKRLWPRFWMRFGGTTLIGRMATQLAAIGTPPFYNRCYLAGLNPNGYVSPKATIFHKDVHRDNAVFIDDRVLIYQDNGGGSVILYDHVLVFRDSIIQTGYGGSVTIGSFTSLQPRCQLTAYKSSIRIGCDVQIAPNCGFYPYDHQMKKGKIIRNQPLKSKGDIVIGDDAWLGFGVVVLDGVTIGKGAVIGAGSVVKDDVPENAIAVGTPAKIIGTRDDLP